MKFADGKTSSADGSHLTLWGFDISAAEFPQQKKTRVVGANRPLHVQMGASNYVQGSSFARIVIIVTGGQATDSGHLRLITAVYYRGRLLNYLHYYFN